MVTEPYRELLTAVATTAGALTGLLFVALSIRSEHGTHPVAPVIQQIRAAAALLAFTSALAISLFGLVPNTNIGYPAVILGVIGTTFTAAAIRSVVGTKAPTLEIARRMGFVVLLFLIFGTEIAAGIVLLGNSSSSNAQEFVGYALIASLLAGVARAWELVRERGTGLFASLAALAGRGEEVERDENIDRTKEQ